MSPAALSPAAELGHVQASQTHAARSLGTISGTVVNGGTRQGIAHVPIQLINSNGFVVQTTTTNGRGQYAFSIPKDGAYVVREVTPGRYTQTSPTFNFSAPSGSFAINPATGKPYGPGDFTYTSGNNNPANGPVGPYFWDTIAPAGNLPFESPINIHVPPINLSPYLGNHYASSVPKGIINHGH